MLSNWSQTKQSALYKICASKWHEVSKCNFSRHGYLSTDQERISSSAMWCLSASVLATIDVYLPGGVRAQWDTQNSRENCPEAAYSIELLLHLLKLLPKNSRFRCIYNTPTDNDGLHNLTSKSAQLLTLPTGVIFVVGQVNDTYSHKNPYEFTSVALNNPVHSTN